MNLNDKGKFKGDDLKSRLAKMKVNKKKVKNMKNAAGTNKGFMAGKGSGQMGGKVQAMF